MLRFPAWKVAIIMAVILWGALLALPNLLTQSQRDSLPGFMPKRALNLGLDLRGGVYILMELDAGSVTENQLRLAASDIQRELTDRNGQGGRIFHTNQVDDGVLRVTLRDEDRMQDALRRIEKANGTVNNAIGGTKILSIRQVGSRVIEVSVSDAAVEQIQKSAQRKTMTIVRRRVDPDGVSEIGLTPQGADRIVLEAPGEPDPTRIKNILSQAGQLTFNLVNADPTEIQAALASRPPPGWRLAPQPSSPGEPWLLIDDTPIMTGADVAQANQSFDPDDGRPAVSFRLNGRGTRAFADASTRNVGRRFAIILDGEVISAPNIREPIIGGTGQISGSFTMEEAQDLAAIIEAGELPAELNFLDDRTVGAGLGADSIRAGTIASVIGLVLIAVFMILTYGLFGIFSVVSLAVNILLIMGALSGLGATLTLPGIAGIILTMGMAVDANVLVFERIREEQRAGRGAMSAMEKGYEGALSTIMDANVTTLIAALVLYQLGSGPVKGFAVTLAIGIFSSVFTAFVVTRWLSVAWLQAARPKRIPI